MTDLATKPTDVGGGDGATPPVEWAPEEPKKKKRHLGWWIGVPSGLVVAGAAVCAAILIAPGVVVAGADVGWQTAGTAQASIAKGFAATEVTVEGAGDSVTLTGAELGLAVDAEAASQEAYGEHPLWNVGAWNPGALPVEVSIDAEKAQQALVAAAPQLFTEPTDAQVAYDDGAGTFSVVEAKSGTGVDLDALVSDIADAVSAGAGDAVTVTAQTSEVEADITTADAQAEADTLNGVVANAGFYVGDEDVLALDAKQVASWLSVTTENGEFQVTVDKDAVQAVVDTLPEKVNRDVQTKEVVTNSAGDELRVIQEGKDGIGLNSTDGITDAFSEALASGNGKYELPVEPVEYETQTLYRHVDANLTTGVATLYENDKVVDTMPFASGTVDHATQTGNFTVYAQLTTQNMGSCDAAGNYVEGGKFDYCTANVPWISYFNGDQGFHGTYWHNNFGNGARMSHGCLNLSVDDALAMYKFLQVGSEVSVHW